MRENLLIKSGIARRRHRDVLPLQPARGVHERAVLFRKARARQTIDRGVDLSSSRRSSCPGALQNSLVSSG